MDPSQTAYKTEIMNRAYEEVARMEKALGLVEDTTPPTYWEIVVNKFNQITTIGFTIDEFQKAMVFLCLVRFIIYSIKYNPITSFKICAIGSVSCFLWAFALNDCVRYYYTYLKYWPLLTRIEWEDISFARMAEMRAMDRVAAMQIKKLTGEIPTYHFEWIKPLFKMMPAEISHITDPIYEYIRKDLYSVLKVIYRTQIRRYLPFVSYILIVRVGKKYCPYHIRWHGTFIMLYSQFVDIFFDSAERAHKMIFYTLLPQGRYQEASNMKVYLGALAFVHISFVMYAMLHAIFSQYFYVPFIVQNIELQVGPRPKKSIYSGGYTAWQDEFVFYDIKFREMMRLWWGFLGRGVKKRPRKRRRKNK